MYMSDLFQTGLQPSHPSDSGVVAVHSNFLSVEAKAAEALQQIKWVGTQRKTEYLSDLLVLQNHKSVAVRRLLAETLPLVGDKSINPQLSSWMAQEGDRKTWLLIQTAIDKITRGLDEIEQDSQVLTVTEAVTYVKKMISQKTFVIEGELTEVRLFQRSQQDMYFMGLKDTKDARLDCMLLSRVAHRAGFPVNDGMMVRVKGVFRIGKQSRFYFDIQHIELTGEGELLRNLTLLQEKLKNEGLFDETRKRQIPAIPQRILLLASPNSAAIKDFTHVLNNRRRGVEIFYYPIKTQGVGAEFEILSALKKANDLCVEHAIDTVVMTRGGGSNDDLFVFNSEHIVRAIFAINTPTIVAIGHERDITLAELVADLRAATPSQAAEKVSLSSAEIISKAGDYVHQSKALIRTRKSQYEGVGEQLWLNCQHLFLQRIYTAKSTYSSLDNQIISIIEATKNQVKTTVKNITDQVSKAVFYQRHQIGSITHLSSIISDRITHSLFQAESSFATSHHQATQLLRTIQNEYTQSIGSIQLKDPQHVLKQGYAMIFQNNKIISSKEDFSTKISTTIKLKDGEITVG